MRSTNKKVAIYEVTPETKLQLKLLAVATNKSMAQVVTALIEEAFNKNKKVSLDGKQRSRFKRIVRKYLGKGSVSIKRLFGWSSITDE